MTDDGQTDYQDPMESIRFMTEDVTRMLLDGTGIPPGTDRIPFSLEEVRDFQEYVKARFGYDGQVLWWIPGGLRFRKALTNQRWMNDDPSWNVWGMRAYKDTPTPVGRWALWVPHDWFSYTLDDGCLEEGLQDIANNFDVDVQRVHLGSPIELAWLYLLQRARERRTLPSMEERAVTDFAFRPVSRIFRKVRTVVYWTPEGKLALPSLLTSRLPYRNVVACPFITSR